MSYNKSMYVVGVFSWWYTAGWRERVTIVSERLNNTLDYFSIGVLARTIFSPYRQISAGSVAGSLDTKFHAFIDRLISRLIGALLRTVIIIVGIVAISLQAIWGVISLIGWAIVPILPIIGVMLAISGWTVSL